MSADVDGNEISEANGTHQARDHVIRFGGEKITLGSLALLMMLAAILVPTVKYSMNLDNPTPPQLLIAISIGMFASVLYLWVLDTTSTILFRSAWVSRSVYGAAIVSILGTSVGVYKDAFVRDPFPQEGEWLVTISDTSGKELVARRSIALAYSRTAHVYWGYAAPPPIATAPVDKENLEVIALDMEKATVEVAVSDSSGFKDIVELPLKQARNATMLRSDPSASPKYRLELARRN